MNKFVRLILMSTVVIKADCCKSTKDEKYNLTVENLKKSFDEYFEFKVPKDAKFSVNLKECFPSLESDPSKLSEYIAQEIVTVLSICATMIILYISDIKD